jgi:hypothetical protein
VPSPRRYHSLTSREVLKRLVGGAALLALLVAAIGVLVGLNSALESGIWGELAFAVVVVAGTIFILNALAAAVVTRSIAALRGWSGLLLAVLAAFYAVIALPLAGAKGAVGLAILLGSTAAVLALSFLRARLGLPRVAVAALAGVVAIVAYAYAAPGGDGAPAPRAVSQPASADLVQLAQTFRPLLFFDSGERFIPLDIELAFAETRVRGCTNAIALDEDCDVVRSPAALTGDYDYVTLEEGRLDPGEPAAAEASAYYFHLTEPPGTGRVYIDYWWYYARNPSPVAAGILCGPAMRWLWVACGDHPADWEGVLVVLEECTGPTSECVEAGGRSFRPVAVKYAQHEHTIPFAWPELQAWWRDPALEQWATGAGVHPLVFVALSSHASYARPCRKFCPQTTRPLPERRDGLQPWINNDDAACGGECLKPLPITTGGEPALWSAFEGPWGRQNCVLAGAFCDHYKAPRGPAFQQRYEDPAGVGED